MNSVKTEILIVGGGAAGLVAAAVAASEKNVTIVDDNPRLGGQIWRAEMGKIKSPDAQRLIESIETNQVSILNSTQVFAKTGGDGLLAETRDGVVAVRYEKLIIATGARERFCRFPAGRCRAFSVRAACRRWSRAECQSRTNVSSSPERELCY